SVLSTLFLSPKTQIMVELVGGALLNVLFDRLASQEVVDFFKGKKSTVKLEELVSELRSADLLLNDAEEKLIKEPKVKNWLGALKEAVYDADDLVYKIKTRAVEKQGKSSFTTKVKNFLPTTSFERDMKVEIDEIVEKLKRLRNDNPGLRRVEKQELPERLPTPLVKESEVYGRDADKEAIIKLLLSDDASAGDNLSVIPIVGMGGIGKTTLAQLVFHDERVKSSFNGKEWFTVEHGKVDCLKLMKTIIKQLGNEDCKTEEPLYLQQKLRETLSGKKFLFVFDDVWDDDRQKWDLLKCSLTSGLHGSKILVTTRSTNVASNMKAGQPIQYDLKEVSYDDGWLLFSKYARIDVNSNEYSDDLQGIGRNIVRKCNGLPLAIKSLASLLAHERNKEKWENILKNDIWDLYEKKSIGILPALWWSYYYLPSHLKPCFAYCALLPKSFVTTKKQLIFLWMAEDLLNSTSNGRMEEFGEECFQDLISRSFFQVSEDESTFVMHDLMHDLANFVSGEFCLASDDNNCSSCSPKVRHLSYVGYDLEKFEALYKAKCLRTFIMLYRGNRSFDMKHLLEPLLHTRSCLRVLSFYNWNIGKLPDSIGDLKYLKYLELLCAKLDEIPETICSLYNLQTLMLDKCTSLRRLPTNIGNLINLRHLFLPYFLVEMPRQIGKLTSLYTLNRFAVGPENRSASIKQLKVLQNLGGTLEISGLENVACVKGDLGTVLKDKKFLSKLTLRWNRAHVSQKEKEVLGALKVHANLKELSISGYPGTDFPNLVGDHLFSNIVTLSLDFCLHCSVLPPLGQLSSLKHLTIESLWGVKEINSEFYFYSAGSSASGTKPFRSLETLCFESLTHLEKWSFPRLKEGDVEGGVFPRLKELRLIHCPKLKSLPGYFPSLRILDTQYCRQILPIVPRGQQMDVAFPSLETLKIKECRGDELLVQGGLPTSLKEISLEFCVSLTALDNCFECLTSLEKLHISHCYRMRCLPKELPASLSDLTIIDCDELTPRLKREKGEDWPIIAHIPNVTIEPNLFYW
ncbi:NB-ARC domain, LRR domain containing protein, partial [Parasponia andersonii]